MLDDKKDDIFLSRWINGELSEEELREFKSHPEYEHYVKIMAGADALDLTDYDIEKELSTLKSKSSYTSKEKSNSVIKLWPYIAVAASIVIILGIFLFKPSESFNANYGEQLTVTLPDGSEMILNAKSTASFDEKNWKKNRMVTLEGEAFFKVKKGSKFTVTTKNGKVSVLGTQFNVQSQNTLFEVTCFEGKVSVVNKENKNILTAGKGYRNLENTAPESWTFDTQKPSWLNNTSSFRSIPIKYVFNELEEQYDLKIKTTEINLETIYTGTFPNNNKEVALRTVFSTLGMKYSLSKDSKTVVLEK
ncbi:FecR family protein [Aquimarina sp. MAR_2010_214]|uniref:FecR family protein n=1 Tax=Aquimarina sp. MAR_2010_214 TaxID=1250026 RepID=UPI000C702B14|nr:FecR family protein [Aquimarina sp. MAR_2010_214]PKV50102.1 FecR family protein [Aquimarina sp. MAR_2010_214]